MKLKTTILMLIAVGVAAVIVAAAYFIGKSHSDHIMEEMQQQLDELHAAERDAAIVKRVSKQMEDIAYQQKEQSDRQRERAEEQTAIATAMREKAELESELARQAEAKAQESANEAERERERAVKQELVAIDEREHAIRARNIADTLYCRTLARTLGTISSNLYKNGDFKMSAKLAYASWYYLKHYHANTYPTDTYQSLCNNTNSVLDKRLHTNAAINAVHPLNDGCVAVTGYGGVELVTSKSEPKVLLQNKAYDFRSVFCDGKNIYALSFRGPLCRLTMDGKLTTCEVPHADYFNIINYDSHTLLLAARRMMVWFDTTEGKVIKTMNLSHKLSAVCKRGSKVALFYDNDTYYEMDATGKQTKHELPIAKGVSAVCYDRGMGCLFVGLRTGSIQIVNTYNRLITTLVAHTGRVTDIDTNGYILVSSSYDKCQQIWDLTHLALESNMPFVEDIQLRRSPFAINPSGTSIEWINPGVLPTPDGSWTLSVCIDSNGRSWVATSTGILQSRYISTTQMAQSLLKRIDNITEDEWEHYIGVGIPYTKFK